MTSYREAENEDEVRGYITRKIIDEEKGMIYDIKIIEMYKEDMEKCLERHSDRKELSDIGGGR